MWNSIFEPLARNSTSENLKFKFVRSDLLPESGESRIKSIMGLIRESRGCIVDLYEANRCSKCGDFNIGELINTITYAKCPHK